MDPYGQDAPPAVSYGSAVPEEYGAMPRQRQGEYGRGSDAPGLGVGGLTQDVMLATASNFASQRMQDMSSNINKYSGELRCYFAVDSVYVLHKLRMLLFPFGQKKWARGTKEGKCLPPKDDHNAPDLYIPVMAFLTYVLVVGVALGQADSFTPEQLGITASSMLVWLCVEVVAVKLGLFLLGAGSALPWREVVANCGYKYVSMTLTLLTAVVTSSSTAYYCALCATSLSLAHCLIRTMRLSVLASEGVYGQESRHQPRMYFLGAVALLQVAVIFLFTSGYIVSDPLQQPQPTTAD